MPSLSIQISEHVNWRAGLRVCPSHPFQHVCSCILGNVCTYAGSIIFVHI